jgi:hypothetical protein
MTNAAWVSLGILAVIIAAYVPFPGGRDFLKSWAKGVGAFVAVGLVIVGLANFIKQCSHQSRHPVEWDRR